MDDAYCSMHILPFINQSDYYNRLLDPDGRDLLKWCKRIAELGFNGDMLTAYQCHLIYQEVFFVKCIFPCYYFPFLLFPSLDELHDLYPMDKPALELQLMSAIGFYP